LHIELADADLRSINRRFGDPRRGPARNDLRPAAFRATDLVTAKPHPDRAAFLAIIDDVIKELERIRLLRLIAARMLAHHASLRVR
jgi:hypothetical protein